MEDSGPEAEHANGQDYPADDDSDHIEEESTSSHLSGQSSGSAPNWRNWRAPVASGRYHKEAFWKLDEKQKGASKSKAAVESLVEICSRYVGRQFPFEAVEHSLSRIPDVLQLKIAFYSFPEDEASIRLYSCLANGSVDEFLKGEQLYKSNNAVNDVVQIGFHLSATLSVALNHPPTNETLTKFKTSVMFDRRKITACSCSCTEQRRSLCTCGASRPRKSHGDMNSAAISCVCCDVKRTRSPHTWCSHVVALCLFRVNEPDRVHLRTPISESLGKLERDQLQKFSQFLISKLPVQNLTVAQQILDELLSNVPNDINMACGAPDPTAGGCLTEYAGWLLDEKAVEDKLAIAISEFVKPSPQIYSDIQTLSAESSPISTEYANLLRPLRGHEPEGVWNLLNIVRHMFRRQDSNAILLLQIISRKILDAGKILMLWFQTKMLVGEDHGGLRFGVVSRGCTRNGAHCNNYSQAHSFHYHQQYASGSNSGGNTENAIMQRYAAASLCDEMVALWRVGALNPAIEKETRSLLCLELLAMHKLVFDCVQKLCSSNSQNNSASSNHFAEWCASEEGISLFTRFRPAIEACLVSWSSVHKNKNHHPRLTGTTGIASFSPHYSREAVENNSEQQYSTMTPLDIIQAEFASGFPCAIKPPVAESIEELFARAEALYAHGYSAMASELACELCMKLLENPPVLVDSTAKITNSNNGSEKSTAENARPTPFRAEYLQCVAVGQMLSRAQFLLNVLSSDPQRWPLSFRVGLFAIDIPRPPCFSKFLEVKLVHQEREVTDCLRRLPPLGPEELAVVRQKALQMCSGYYATTGLRPPITLGAYIFEVLCSPNASEDDREIGFQAALKAVGFKLPVCEVEHPMLYESFRHQKGELAVQLLLAHKDDVSKLERILDRLLDRQPAKTPSAAQEATPSSTEAAPNSSTVKVGDSINEKASTSSHRRQGFRRVMSLPSSSDANNNNSNNNGDARDAEDSSALEDEQEDRAIAARLRCVLTVRPNNNTNNNNGQQAQEGGANQAGGHRYGNRPSGADSSAPETTSSDNSPTFSRRTTWRMPSSLSFNSEANNHQQLRAAMQQSRPSNNSRWGGGCGHLGKSSNGGANGPSRVLQPTEPNQPSEAAAQFVFELAKQVLQKAGGDTSQTYFQRPVQTRPHAALHMCAFQIGLHAMALHNAVTVTWLSRLYSTYGSWIIAQAIEIGAPALRLLIDAWEGHLTPSEVARLADQAGRVPDRQVIRSSVELAYRSLEFASCLTVAEVRRALDQCEELSLDKVKSACLAVEQAAVRGGTVPQDILFATAEKLHDIYQKLQAKAGVTISAAVHAHQPAVHPVPVAVQQHQPMVPAHGRLPFDPQQQAIVPGSNSHHQSVFSGNQFGNSQYGPYGGYAAAPYAANQPYATIVQFPPTSSSVHQQPQYHLVPVHFTLAQYGAQGVSPLHPVVGPSQGLYGAAMPHQALEQNPFGLAAVMEHHPMQSYGLPQLPGQPPQQMPQQVQPQQQQQQQQQQQAQPPQHPQPQNQPSSSSSNQPTAATTAAGTCSTNTTSTASQPPNANETNSYFLLAAFRVGMLAMEQIRRNLEDKPASVKVSKAPPPLLGNVKWLFHTAAVIGPEKVDEVCRAILHALPDAAVLHEMCDQLEEYMTGLMHNGGNNPSVQAAMGQLQQAWNQMYHKALSSYRTTIQHKTSHLLQAEQEDFIHMLTNAKKLFTKTPNGTKQFNEMLTAIRKNKNIRKDFVQKLLKALQMHRTDGGPQTMF